MAQEGTDQIVERDSASRFTHILPNQNRFTLVGPNKLLVGPNLSAFIDEERRMALSETINQIQWITKMLIRKMERLQWLIGSQVKDLKGLQWLNGLQVEHLQFILEWQINKYNTITAFLHYRYIFSFVITIIYIFSPLNTTPIIFPSTIYSTFHHIRKMTVYVSTGCFPCLIVILVGIECFYTSECHTKCDPSDHIDVSQIPIKCEFAGYVLPSFVIVIFEIALLMLSEVFYKWSIRL